MLVLYEPVEDDNLSRDSSNDKRDKDQEKGKSNSQIKFDTKKRMIKYDYQISLTMRIIRVERGRYTNQRDYRAYF